MSKVLLFVVALLVLTAAAVQAEVVMTEDWETGTDMWIPRGSPVLDSTKNTTPGGSYSIKTADNVVSSMTRTLNMGQTNWWVKWQFFDNGSTEEMLQMAIPRFTSPGYTQNVALGVCPTGGGATHYTSYIQQNGTVFNVSATSIPRTTGIWHSMMMAADGAGGVSFYIDGQLAAQKTTTPNGVYAIIVGSESAYADSGSYYDDIMVGYGTPPAVPEPSSLIALGTSLSGLLGFGIRSRRK